MFAGVAVALVANLLFSMGFVIEKRALSALPRLSAGRPARLLLHLLRSPLWILGAASLLLGFAAQLAVYRTLPLVAAQGLFVTGLVMLVLLSALFLGERAGCRERWGMEAILTALVMIVFSLHNSTETISEAAPMPVLLALCLPSLALGLALFLSAERRSRRRHRLPTAGVPYGVAVGFLYGVSSLAIKGMAGLLDFGDMGDTLVAVLASPYPYLLMFTGTTGLVLSQTALQRCRASLIVPVCTTVNFLYASVSGTVAFAEPLPGEPLRLGLRLGGAALAVAVLVALPRHEPDAGKPVSEGPDAREKAPAAGQDGTNAEAVAGAVREGRWRPGGRAFRSPRRRKLRPSGSRSPPADRPLSATLPPPSPEHTPERQ